ncbi:MAG: hypothetical protein AAGF58_02235 [Pseudomonadota bacterium]
MSDDSQLTDAQRRLKNKVLNSGRGITMEQAITRSSMAVKALQADFASIAERDLNRMREINGEMQTSGADHGKLTDKLYDVCHELRGTAGTFGFKVTSVAANKLCRLIDANREMFVAGETRAILAAKVHIDAIGLDLTHGPSTMIGEAENRMLDGLSALAKKLGANQDAPA